MYVPYVTVAHVGFVAGQSKHVLLAFCAFSRLNTLRACSFVAYSATPAPPMRTVVDMA